MFPFSSGWSFVSWPHLLLDFRVDIILNVGYRPFHEAYRLIALLATAPVVSFDHKLLLGWPIYGDFDGALLLHKILFLFGWHVLLPFNVLATRTLLQLPDLLSPSSFPPL